MGQNTIYLFDNIYGACGIDKEIKTQYIVYGDDNYIRFYNNISSKLKNCYTLCELFIDRLLNHFKLDNESFADLIWYLLSDGHIIYENVTEVGSIDVSSILMCIDSFTEFEYVIKAVLKDHLENHNDQIPFVVNSIMKAMNDVLDKKHFFFLLLNKKQKTVEFVIIDQNDESVLLTEYLKSLKSLCNRLLIPGNKFAVLSDSEIQTLLGKDLLEIVKKALSINQCFAISSFDLDNNGVVHINNDFDEIYSFDKFLKEDD